MCFEEFFDILDVKRQKRTWSSSHFFSGQYLINQKYVQLSLFWLYMLWFKLQDGTWVHIHVLVSCHHSTHMCKFVNMGGST